MTPEKNLVIHIFTEAGGDFRINGKLHNASEGDIVMCLPEMSAEFKEDVSRHSLTLTTALEVVLELPSTFDTDLIAAIRDQPHIRPTQSEFEFIRSTCELIDRAREKGGIYCAKQCNSLSFAIFWCLGAVYERMKGDMPQEGLLRDEELSDRFFHLLREHFRTERKVAYYANLMSITPKYLSKTLKRITGRNASEWLDDAILLEIKNLLKTSNKTILEISEELGFCNPSAFVHYFRLHTGATPLRYRRSDEW